MNAQCPSELALERHLADPAASPIASHVDACERCGERLAQMEREGNEFRAFVYPATVDAVMQAASPQRRSWLWLTMAVPASALAVASVLFMLRPAAPPEDYVGLRGEPLGFSVFVGTPEGARAVTDGENVPATAALRFKIRPSAPCHLWVVSVDAAIHVSGLYPATSDAAAIVGRAETLPGGAMLDGTPGPERIYAVCTPQPVPFADIVQAVRASAPQGEAGVRGAKPLEGLPYGSLQTSILLEKRR